MRIPTLEYFEWQRGVIAIQNNPPESPSRGDSYIVGVGTGGWAGHNDNIAIYDVSGWTFIAPVNGMFCYNKADGYLYEYKTSWDKATNLQNTDYLKKDGSRAITDNWNVDGSDTLFIDKTNGRVGIKTASPQENLNVNGNSKISGILNAGGYKNITEYYNSFFGDGAGYSNTTGSHNSFFGYRAGYLNTTGVRNIFIGNYTGYNNTTTERNTFVGYYAGYYNTEGYYNSFFGYMAGYSNTSGYRNSFFGYYAGYYNKGGYYNSFFGHQAGVYLADGASANENSIYSVFLGANTKSKQANQTNEIVIGYNAIGEGSNTIRLGNTSITDVITSGVIKSGGYKSSDGSAGITKTIEIKDYENKTHTLTFKNGILTAHSYA